MAKTEYMTVGKLIEHLKTFDPSLEVWIAEDDEGNGYRALYYEPEIRMVDKDENHDSDHIWDAADLLEEIAIDNDVSDEVALEIMNDEYRKVLLV